VAVTFQSWAALAAGTTSAAPAYPGSLAAEDLVLAFIGSKNTTTTPLTTPAQPTDWLKRISAVSGTTATTAADNGSVRMTAFSREATAGLSGTVTFSVTNGSPTMGRMARLTKAGGTFWDIDSRQLADTTVTTTPVVASAPGTARVMDVTSGDVLVFAVALKSDTHTHTRTGDGITVAGCTLGSFTWETVDTTNSGNDGAMYVGRCSVTAGTASGNPVYTATASSSGNSDTAVTVIRCREIATLPGSTGPLIFDHGTDETDLTVANSDDGGDPAITSLSVSGGGLTPVYDDTDPIRGDASIRCNVTGSNGTSTFLVGHQLGVSSDRTWILRARIRIDGSITAGDRIFTVLAHDASFSSEGRLTAGGAVELRNAGATVQDTSTATYASSDLLDFAVTTIYGAGNGQILVDLIDPATGSSTEQLASNSSQDTVQNGGTSLVQLGVCRSVANPLTTTVDDVVFALGTTIPTLPNIGGATEGTASVTGAGSVSATAVQVAGVSTAGAGSVAANATQVAGSSAAGAGSGSAAGSVIVPGTASVAGVGSVSADASVSALGTASVTGEGSVSATVVQGATATVAGTGSVTAAVQLQPGATSIEGAGSVTATVVQRAVATVTGTGSVTADADGTASGTATITGTGSVTADATQIQRAASSVTGAGSVTAAGSIQGAAAVEGAGSVTAVVVQVATADIQVIGAVAASVGQTIEATASISGAGSVTAAGRTKYTIRPNTGTTARPNSGTTSRPVGVPALTARP
jgi:hypothetical protein